MYVGDLITKIRLRTGKNRYSVDSSGVPTEGIPQALVIDFLNDAKEYLQAGIVSSGSLICDLETNDEISIVSGTETYETTYPIHMGNKIRNVQYSFSGEERDYRDLPQLRDEARINVPAPYAQGYIRRGRVIEIIPPPSATGPKIRPEYPREWDNLALRAGQITSKNGPPSTAIVLDNDSYLTNYLLSAAQFVSIVSLAGVVKDYNVAVTSYDSGTRTLTIPSTTLVGVAGDFIAVGEWATTHTDFLPSRLAEQYVKLEAQMRMFDQSSSVDAIRETRHLATRYNAIIEGYEDEILDDIDIPIHDPYIME